MRRFRNACDSHLKTQEPTLGKLGPDELHLEVGRTRLTSTPNPTNLLVTAPRFTGRLKVFELRADFRQ
jgi:hypothetical protein